MYLPLNLLKSNDVSLMVKSAWNGAICSLNINKCLTKNSCPSIFVCKKRQEIKISSHRDRSF